MTIGRTDPTLIKLSRPGQTGKMTVAMWPKGVSLVLPGQAVHLLVDDEKSRSVLAVPRDQVEHVAGPLFRGWLDETSAVVDAASDAEWAHLVERARGVAVDPRSLTDPEGPRPRRAVPEQPPRWQFWRR